jgi:hypothetical protein
MNPEVWEQALNKHSGLMEEEIKKVTGETNYLAIFFGAVVVVGIICTILYFTKWKKESYDEDEDNE